jgi:hypothetical protein
VIGKPNESTQLPRAVLRNVDDFTGVVLGQPSVDVVRQSDVEMLAVFSFKDVDELYALPPSPDGLRRDSLRSLRAGVQSCLPGRSSRSERRLEDEGSIPSTRSNPYRSSTHARAA